MSPFFHFLEKNSHDLTAFMEETLSLGSSKKTDAKRSGVVSLGDAEMQA